MDRQCLLLNVVAKRRSVLRCTASVSLVELHVVLSVAATTAVTLKPKKKQEQKQKSIFYKETLWHLSLK